MRIRARERSAAARAGRSVGLGSWLGASGVDFGLRYAHLKSSSAAQLHERPDLHLPPSNVLFSPNPAHQLNANIESGREFERAGYGLVKRRDPADGATGRGGRN